MTQRGGRIADGLRLLVFLILAAALAVLQLDKASEQNGSVANLVPAGLGGFADAKVAASTLESDHAKAGARLEELLKHRPMEAAHLSNFAVWAAEEDDPRAGPALSSAAKRGWRDRYTQMVVLASAVAEGKVDVAAARLDALARLKLDQQSIDMALSYLVQSEEGRQAVASRISESDYLLRRFVHFARSARPLGPDVIDTFAMVAREKPDLSCHTHGEMASVVLNSGKAGFLERVWPARCAKSPTGDFAFDGTKEEKDWEPFAWKLIRSAGLSTRSGTEEGTLTVTNRDPIRRSFAHSSHVLEPGLYAVAVSTKAGQTNTPGFRQATVALDIHCITPDVENRPRIFHAEEEGTYRVRIAQDCPIQSMVLSVSRGTAENVKVEVKPSVRTSFAPVTRAPVTSPAGDQLQRIARR
ncbi:hypothetical protein [Qipengyuania sp.]|uniref:hypothetical protein n=1 Tax=Qipengyuania sp. TaxID=2004515 RepID=UPI003AF483E7